MRQQKRQRDCQGDSTRANRGDTADGTGDREIPIGKQDISKYKETPS